MAISAAAALDPRTAKLQHSNARLGMLIYLVSKTMFFVALVGAYIVLANTHSWPPEGAPTTIDRLIPTTAILLVGAVTIFVATRGLKQDNAKLMRLGLSLTLAAGLAFVVVQIVEWRAIYHQLWLMGMHEDTYAHFFFVLTGFHMVYVASGVGIIAFSLFKAIGADAASQRTRVELCALWWHYCGGVWVVLLLALFVLPRVF